MAKAKSRGGKKQTAKKKKTIVRRKPAVKRKPAAPATAHAVVIPGAWPFPMPAKP